LLPLSHVHSLAVLGVGVGVGVGVDVPPPLLPEPPPQAVIAKMARVSNQHAREPLRRCVILHRQRERS